MQTASVWELAWLAAKFLREYPFSFLPLQIKEVKVCKWATFPSRGRLLSEGVSPWRRAEQPLLGLIHCSQQGKAGSHRSGIELVASGSWQLLLITSWFFLTEHFQHPFKDWQSKEARFFFSENGACASPYEKEKGDLVTHSTLCLTSVCLTAEAADAMSGR